MDGMVRVERQSTTSPEWCVVGVLPYVFQFHDLTIFSHTEPFILHICTAVPSDYIDAMDVSNYVTVHLTKPMGIVFEENDEEYGGIFVQSLKEDSAAAAVLQPGDQLVGVDALKVSGKAFDDALNAIVESNSSTTTKLVLFRGSAKQLYGPTGASQAWLDELLLSETETDKKEEA